MDMRENADLGKLILRLVLGITILLHGFGKLTGGVDGIAQMLQGHGMPGFLAYGVYVDEVLAPLMVLAGFHARIGAALIAANMVVAIALVHAREVLKLGENGEWAIELQAMFLFTAVALALLGPGRYSVNGK